MDINELNVTITPQMKEAYEKVQPKAEIDISNINVTITQQMREAYKKIINE